MSRWLQLALGVTAVTAVALLCWGAFGLNQHLIVAIDHMNDAAVGVTQTVAKVNGKNGTVAEVDKLILASKSLLVHTDMVVAHEDRQLARYDAYVGQMADDVHSTMLTTQDTLKTTQGAVSTLTTDIQTANESIAALQPLLEASRHTLLDVDARVNDPNITATVTNIQGMTGAGVGILNDTHRVTQKLADDFTAQKPWYRRLGTDIEDIVKVFAGARLAR
jgi:hypothetical protein